MDDTNYIYTYYQHICDGSITVGTWVKLLYELIISNLENKVVFFDQRKANRAISFIEKFCHHSKGKLSPQLIRLEEWQKAMLSCIFGLVDEKGMRAYREVFIVIARKCGKSLLASGIAQYMAYADGEPGADTYFIAKKLDQAEIVFSDFWQSVSHEPDLMKITKRRKNDIYIPSTNTSIKKLPFSEKSSDGMNPHCSVCDEVAAWVGEAGLKQYAVLTSALGSRDQPLIVSITTANYVSDGIYDDLFKRASGYLKGTSKETRLLPFIYQIDDVTRWDDISELRKSIPNLGVSVSVSYILDEIAKARESLSSKAEYLTKFCNIKQNASSAWLNAQDIKKSFPPNNFRLEDFRGCYALGGIDLSASVDLTAAVLLVQKNGVIYYFTHFWLPESKLEEATARDGLPYSAYIQRGFLTLAGENAVDYKSVYQWFVDMIERYKIYVLKVGYDKWSSQYLVQEMAAYGFHMESCLQAFPMTGVINDCEGLLKSGLLQCADDNDLAKIHWLDAAMKQDGDTNRRKLVKISKNAHVDGVAAMLDALCMRHNHWDECGRQLSNEVIYGAV